MTPAMWPLAASTKRASIPIRRTPREERFPDSFINWETYWRP